MYDLVTYDFADWPPDDLRHLDLVREFSDRRSSNR